MEAQRLLYGSLPVTLDGVPVLETVGKPRPDFPIFRDLFHKYEWPPDGGQSPARDKPIQNKPFLTLDSGDLRRENQGNDPQTGPPDGKEPGPQGGKESGSNGEMG